MKTQLTSLFLDGEWSGSFSTGGSTELSGSIDRSALIIGQSRLHAYINHIFVYNTALNIAELKLLQSGKLEKVPYPVAGNAGYAVNLGQTKVIYLPKTNFPTSAFTVMFWFNLRSRPAMKEYCLIEKALDYRILLFYDPISDKVRARVKFGTISWVVKGSESISFGEESWQHFGITWNGKDLQLFIDAQLQVGDID